LFVYTLAFGIFMGIGSVFDGTVWVNMFGREHQGAIRGFVATAGVIGAAIGPIVFGVAYDHLGSYNPSIWLGIVLAMIIMVSGLLVKLPTQNR
jgi:nitrate/nitrite transporter NarK